MSIPNASKYVIIGAGIHGQSTAYQLALELKKRNLGGGEDILVIDKSGIGSGEKSRYSLALHPESW